MAAMMLIISCFIISILKHLSIIIMLAATFEITTFFIHASKGCIFFCFNLKHYIITGNNLVCFYFTFYIQCSPCLLYENNENLV